ncbi:MAG: helix-turn-helix domain-containing protein [Promicromonosporaceae bacterium]|nr:helix-turn-helix domain-containing protein [Promicromonosporaceae bacterium]
MNDDSTRQRLVELITAEGPVTAAELAKSLGYTQAGVRRHLAHLEDDGAIVVRQVPGAPAARRGRPARAYVVAPGRSGLPTNYCDLALGSLRYLQHVGGQAAIDAFAKAQYADVVEQTRPLLTATDQIGKARQLAEVLTADGFAATVRPVTNTPVPVTQLSQGHCPMRQAASQYPQLCEAERQAFSTLLGTHLQRLATIAGGAHACVINIPLNAPDKDAND